MSDKPGYLFQTSIQIGERMALTVSGNLSLDASAKEIENELDRIFEAMQKQEMKRMKIPAIKGALQDQKDALQRTEKRYEELAFQEQGRKLNNAEKAQQDTCFKQIETLKEQVEKGEEILAAMEKEAA
jgi:archaellum component FlaC